MSSATCFNLDQSKLLSSGNGLIATFLLSPAASLNLGRSQYGVIGKELNICFFGECTTTATCTYVQSDLALHSSPFYHRPARVALW